MEEKILEVILEAKKISETSKKYFVEIGFNGCFNKLTINIKLKNSYEYVETIEIYLNKIETERITEIVEMMKKYEEEE